MKVIQKLYLARAKDPTLFLETKERTNKFQVPDDIKGSIQENEIKNHYPVQLSKSNAFRLFSI